MASTGVPKSTGIARCRSRQPAPWPQGECSAVNRRGLEALVRFAELDYWGTFWNVSLNKSFQRACEKVGIAGNVLCHMFGTEMYRRHDPLVVQQLMLHRSSEITRRYILGAIPDVLQRAIDAVNEELSAGSRGQTPLRQRLSG